VDIEKISKGIIFIILTIQTYWDLRYKKLPLLISLVGVVIGVPILIFSQRELMDILLALLLGVIFLLIGKITREAIGYGDGILLIVMGLFYSAKQMWSICIMAFVFAGVVALVLLLIFRKKGNYEIPFVPFLLLANCIHSI